MEKKLPFTYPPLVDVYSGDAGVVAVQQTMLNQMALIIKNHFMIVYDFANDTPGFDWTEFIEPITYIDLHHKVAEYGLVNTIMDSINENKYVHIVIDHYYIKNSGRFHRMHFTHDTATIYGYDREQELFYVADNFSQGKYKVIAISFDEICAGRKDIEYSTIESMKIKKDINFELGANEIYNMVDCFLYSKAPNGKGNEKYIYGIAVYDILINLANQILIEDNSYDIRPYYIIENHCNIGSQLLKYLSENYNFDKSILEKCFLTYEKLKTNIQNIKNLYLKLRIVKDVSIAENLKDRIVRTRELEKEALKLIHNEIRPVSFE